MRAGQRAFESCERIKNLCGFKGTVAASHRDLADYSSSEKAINRLTDSNLTSTDGICCCLHGEDREGGKHSDESICSGIRPHATSTFSMESFEIVELMTKAQRLATGPCCDIHEQANPLEHARLRCLD